MTSALDMDVATPPFLRFRCLGGSFLEKKKKKVVKGYAQGMGVTDVHRMFPSHIPREKPKSLEEDTPALFSLPDSRFLF